MLLALDRDLTVDVGRWAGRREPHERLLSLEFVRWLAHETEAEVWAIGNQDLVDEAEIPGMREVRNRIDAREASADDLLPADSLRYPSRADRVRLVGRLFPNKDRRIVIDDVNLAHLEDEGWMYYTAWEFIESVEREEFQLPSDPPVPLTHHPHPEE